MSPLTTKPIAAAVFTSVDRVEEAIERLLRAGFSQDQISVICSDKVQQQVFRDLEPEQHVTTSSQLGPLQGGLIGAALGGAASVLGIVTTGGVAIAAIGPLLVGGITGTLLGLLVGSGIEDEQARFFDQAVSKGQILVTVGAPQGLPDDRLALAERTLAEAGALPIELHES